MCGDVFTVAAKEYDSANIHVCSNRSQECMEKITESVANFLFALVVCHGKNANAMLAFATLKL